MAHFFMAFSTAVEMINLRTRKKMHKRELPPPGDASGL